ncbi:MAG: hypothetical protein WA051_02490 [Minisyncoccia bacterium]
MKKDKFSILKSKKIEARKRQYRLRIGLVAITILVVALVLPPLVARIPLLEIRTVNVEGTKTIESSAIVDFVNAKLSETYLKVFPRDTYITAGKGRLKEGLLNEYPAILDIKLSFHTPHILLIEITEREPSVLWCAGSDNKNCYFADSQGFIYERAPEFSSPVYVVFRNGIKNENPMKQSISGKTVFERINVLEKNFSVLGLKVKEISFQPNEVVNFYLNHGALYISLRGDDKLTFDNLSSLLLNPKTDLRDGVGGIKNSYIDLRFGNKIFYK